MNRKKTGNQMDNDGRNVFIINLSGYAYEVEPMNVMTTFFDGQADETAITKL